jgi:5,10-methylenetetrahydrofolate reductase
MLEHMHKNIPGIEVDPATFEAMEGLAGDEAKSTGVDIAVSVIGQLRSLAEVRGCHLMAPGWEAEAVPRVLESAGLVRR